MYVCGCVQIYFFRKEEKKQVCLFFSAWEKSGSRGCHNVQVAKSPPATPRILHGCLSKCQLSVCSSQLLGVVCLFKSTDPFPIQLSANAFGKVAADDPSRWTLPAMRDACIKFQTPDLKLYEYKISVSPSVSETLTYK